MEQRSGCDLDGRYANFAQIAYTEDEFVLAFGQVLDEPEHPKIHTRIVMSPAYVRVLLDTLTQAIREFRRIYEGKN